MKKQGFSLVELLVVLSIICILTALLMPALSVVKEKAIEVRCFDNLKQIYLAIKMYEEDHFGFMPAGWTAEVADPEAEDPVVQSTYWHNKILPYTGDIESKDAAEADNVSVLSCPKVAPGSVQGYTDFIKVYYAGGGGGRWSNGFCNGSMPQHIVNGVGPFEGFAQRSNIPCDGSAYKYNTIAGMPDITDPVSAPLIIVLCYYTFDEAYDKTKLRGWLDSGGMLLGIGVDNFKKYIAETVYPMSESDFKPITADDPIFHVMYDATNVLTTFTPRGLYIGGILKAVYFTNRHFGCALMHPSGDGLPGERAFEFVSNVVMSAYQNYFTGSTSYGYNFNLGMKNVGGNFYKIYKYPSPDDTLLVADAGSLTISGSMSLAYRHRRGVNMIFLDGHIEKGYKGNVSDSIFTLEED